MRAVRISTVRPLLVMLVITSACTRPAPSACTPGQIRCVNKPELMTQAIERCDEAGAHWGVVRQCMQLCADDGGCFDPRGTEPFDSVLNGPRDAGT
jgi:hypothetical protein